MVIKKEYLEDFISVTQHAAIATYPYIGKNNKKAADKLVADVTSMLDKLAKNNIIHKNKSANLKSKLSKHVNSLKPVKKAAKPKTKSS